MPARVTYFLSDDTLHQHHLHHDPRSSKMPSAVIAVRPPSRAQVQTLLSPPVVAKLSSKKCSAGIHFFTTAVLLDASGQVAEGSYLQGTTAATGVLLDASTMIFAFPDLSIATTGRYTIRLDVYGMYPESTEGAALIAQLETTEISVYDGPVPSQRPSSTERDVIRLARSTGVPLSPPQ